MPLHDVAIAAVEAICGAGGAIICPVDVADIVAAAVVADVVVDAGPIEA